MHDDVARGPGSDQISSEILGFGQLVIESLLLGPMPKEWAT